MSVIQQSPWTGLTVLEFANIFGMNMPHFGCVHRAGIDPGPLDTCDDVWYQEAWQSLDKASREDLAFAIFRAEYDIARELKYWPYPRWIEDEELLQEQYHRPGYYSTYGYGARGRLKTVRTKFGRFIEGGRRVKLLVDASPTVSVNIPEWMGTATFTLPAAGWTGCEFQAVVVGHSGFDEWWLHPTYFVNNGDGTGNLMGHLNSFLDPIEYLGRQHTDGPLDGNDPTIYLETGQIEIWRFYNDPSQPATLEWEPGATCDDVACCPTQQTGCITPHNRAQGEVAVQPATWTASTATFAAASYTASREPDRARLWYRAGLPWDTAGYQACRMRNDWAQTVAYLAAAYLVKNICACESTYRAISYWQEDPEPDEPVSMYPASQPFGPPKRGALYAWQRVSRSSTAHGTLI